MDKSFDERCDELAAHYRDILPLLGEDPEAGDSISAIYRDVRQKPCIEDPRPGSVDVVFCSEQLDETVAAIREVIGAGGTYGDIAVLVRGNAEGSLIAGRLVAEGIPVISDDSLFVKASVTVRRLVSQLSLTDRPEEDGTPSVSGYLARSMQVDIPDNYHSLVDLAESFLRNIREA